VTSSQATVVEHVPLPAVERAQRDETSGAPAEAHVVERARRDETSDAPGAAPVVDGAERDETRAPAAETAEPAAPVETPVPAAAAPTGPLTVERLRESWPDVLARLERISRSAWLVASAASVADLRDGDVLTLAFRSASDLNRFKQRSADGGPSEALRAAIRGVTGVTVKYLARMDDDAAPDGPGSGSGDGGTGPRTPPTQDGGGSTAPAPRAPAARTTEPRPPVAERRSGAPERQASASAAVTEWAVAPIPSSAPSGPGRPLAVDDDPDEAPARTATATIAREGEVLPAGDVVPSMDEPPAYDDEDAPPPPPDDDIPTIVAPRLAPTVTARADGVQRYGEAVVRQVLGATFVREETHESGTRFS
jgi:DNA polymerase-3 subunit gamma/tau